MKKDNIKSGRGVKFCKQYNEGRLTGLVPFCVGTAYCHTLLKGRWREGERLWEEEEEDINSYWMTSKKKEDTENETGGTRSQTVENSLRKLLFVDQS